MEGLLVFLGFTAAFLLVVWIAQTAALLACREPRAFALPLRHSSDSEVVRWSLKFALQAALLGLVIFYPLAAGEKPLDYLSARVLPPQWLLMFRTMAMTLFVFSFLLLINVQAGWVYMTCHYRTSRAIKKVARACLIPLPLAFMEEAVFRGVVLEAFPTLSAKQSDRRKPGDLPLGPVVFSRPLPQTAKKEIPASHRPVRSWLHPRHRLSHWRPYDLAPSRHSRGGRPFYSSFPPVRRVSRAGVVSGLSLLSHLRRSWPFSHGPFDGMGVGVSHCLR